MIIIRLIPVIICIFSSSLIGGNCSNGSAGTTVVHINGILTTDEEAEINLLTLKKRVQAAVIGTPVSNECLAFRPAYNETSGGLGLGDLWQSTQQRLNQDMSLFTRYVGDVDIAPDWFQDAFNNVSASIDEAAGAPELDAHIRLYEDERRAGNTAILVAHSQGNLYANAEYRKLLLRGWQLPDTRLFSIVSVATPARVVEGGGPWTTLLFDRIHLIPGSLDWTTTNLPQHLDGHGFVKRYLNPGSRSLTRITQHVLDAIPIRSNPPSGPTWTQKSPANSPTARYSHKMAYDSARGQVVLFGGWEGIPRNDTWVWDGTNWTQKSPANSPTARRDFGMAYDSSRRQVVLFGGFDGAVFRNDTWVWDGTNWTQKSPANSPTVRSWYAMAYDSAREQVVLFGGVQASIFQNDTWVWDGTNWTQKSPTNSPTARYSHEMAYDSSRRQVLLFGGVERGSGGLDTIRNDTWVWDGTNWTQKSPANSPTALSLQTMAYDSAREQVVLFGGWDGIRRNDTWVWDGTNWTQKSPTNSPTARYWHAMAYDPVRGQAVLFGGWDGAIRQDDTWVWP